MKNSLCIRIIGHTTSFIFYIGVLTHPPQATVKEELKLISHAYGRNAVGSYNMQNLSPLIFHCPEKSMCFPTRKEADIR